MKWHYHLNWNDLSESLTDQLWICFLLILPFQAALRVALVVKGSLLQPQQGGRMVPLSLSVPCSWQLFTFLVYWHGARLTSVTGSCTNLRSAAGCWEQLSWDWRHLNPPHTHPLPTPQQNYTQQRGREGVMIRSSAIESLKETESMATGGSEILICAPAAVSHPPFCWWHKMQLQSVSNEKKKKVACKQQHAEEI